MFKWTKQMCDAERGFEIAQTLKEHWNTSLDWLSLEPITGSKQMKQKQMHKTKPTWLKLWLHNSLSDHPGKVLCHTNSYEEATYII